MLPAAASNAAAVHRPAAQRGPLRQSRLLQQRQRQPGRRLTSVQAPGAPPAPLAPEDDGQDSELELSVRPVQGQEQPAAVPPGRAVEGLLPHHWEEHLQTLQAPERRDLRRYIDIVRRINALRGAMAALNDDELAAKTGELRYRIEAAGLGGPDPGSSPAEILGGISSASDGSAGGSRERRRAQAAEWRKRGLLGGLPEDVVIEGFAVVREAAHRVLGMRHYDVQLLGGLVLHEGQVAEMRTGEGKTLVATLPAYVNALTGRGVHIITVNGYLAQRDAEWIGKVFKFLGLSVGVLSTESSTFEQRIAAMACDVTYTTAYDLAFTYLQDNTNLSPRDVAIRRPLHFALVDEADSLLIDEAINPFIITGQLFDARSQGARWAEAIAVARMLTHHSIEQLSIDEKKWKELERQFDCLVQPKYMTADLSNRGMVSAVKALVERGTVRLCTDASGRLAVALVNPVGAEPGSKGGRGGGRGASSDLPPGSSSKSDDSNGEGSKGEGSKGDHEGGSEGSGEGSSSETSSSSSGGGGGGSGGGSSLGGSVFGSRKANAAAKAKAAAEAAAAPSQPVRLVLSYISQPNGLSGSSTSGGQAIADVQLDSSKQLASELEKRGLRELPAGEVTQQQLEAAMPAVMWGGSQSWGPALTTALRALHCYIRDMHYIVDPAAQRVVLIDQGTGRERVKSRWQAGVHQAVEAKEGVPVSKENNTTASVSYQSLFGYYRRLAGMTGTGFTEQQEFEETYGLAVLRVPPHRPSVRRDEPMRLFLFQEGRDQALLDLLLEAQQRRQPVLIGSGTVEESAQLDALIRRKLAHWQQGPMPWIDHVPQVELLNARPETARREATIIAQAGLPGSVTIATALAGRGTDILLGGNPKGLVQMLLENRLLERLAGEGAGDLGNFDRRLPLSNLAVGFLDLDELDQLPLEQLPRAAADPGSVSPSLPAELPLEICSAYCELRAALAAVLPEAAAAGQPGLPPLVPLNGATQNGAAQNGAALPAPQQSGDAGAAGPATAAPLPPPAQLPWRRYGVGYSKRAAQYAADWLSQQLEAAEMQRAHLRLSECLALPGPAAFQEAARRIQEAGHEVHHHQDRAPAGSGDARLRQLEAALQRFVLLQWLWFERQCGMYAREVCAAGGLRVIIVSLPDNRRSELQLRGRAGRQGDPGESHLVLSYDDPVMNLRSPGVAALPHAAYEMACWQGAYTVAQCREHLRWMEQDVLHAMRRDPKFARYRTLDAEDDPGFLAFKMPLCAEALSMSVVTTVISNSEAYMRNARKLVREYDQVLDRYRRHIYTLRRVLVQGGATARQDLLHGAFQDAARGIVSRLIDADQPPHRWPLLELVQWLQAIVNSCPPDKAAPFNGRRWLCQSSLVSVLIRIDLRPAETAQQLAAALRSGGALPEPLLIDPAAAAEAPVVNPQWQGRNVSEAEMLPDLAAQQQEKAAAADAAAAAAAAGRPRLRERQALAAFRAQLNAAPDGDWSDDGGVSAALGELRGVAPPPRGRYAAAARQLVAWVAEQLVVQHRNKRAILKQWYRAQSVGSGAGGATEVAAEAVMLVQERFQLATRLDALWAGFLEACQRKNREVSMRAFASYNPLEEYQLETSELFAQLLLDFRQQAVGDAFRDVDTLSIEAAARAGAAAASEEEAGGSSTAGSGLRSVETEAAGAAEDLGALFDRLGLGARVAAEAERLAEAERHAAAAAAQSAMGADVDAAFAAFESCAAAANACKQTVLLAVRACRQQNAALRQLGLYSGRRAEALLMQAHGLLRDVVACAHESLAGPARNAGPRWADVQAAVDGWLAADTARDVAGTLAARERLRQLRQEAAGDERVSRSWAVRATELAVEIQPLLDQALALPQEAPGAGSSASSSANGSSGAGSSSSSSSPNGASPFVRAVEASSAVAAMVAEIEGTAAQLEGALRALDEASAKLQATLDGMQQAARRRAQQQPGQQPSAASGPPDPAAPDPAAVMLGLTLGALAASRLNQQLGQPGGQQPGMQQGSLQPGAQQGQLPGSTDLPSAVLASLNSSPQQASSAAIDAALAQTGSPASGHGASSSYSQQAAAAAELKAQAEQLTPEQGSEMAQWLLQKVIEKVDSSKSSGEALANMQPMQELLAQQPLPPAGAAQQSLQPERQPAEQQRQPEQQPGQQQ